MKQVIPLASEPIENEDGTEKQDCELNAAKRLLKKIRSKHPKLKIMIVGDGLYSKQPFIKDLLDRSMAFTLVAKPTDHTTMFKTLANREIIGSMKELELVDEQGNLHTYRWSNDIDLNGNKESKKVNFFEYEFFNQKLDKTTYKNSWVTNIIIGKENVQTLVQGGRARWKVENETFNTLKNQGYHIEHNFGHGKKNLCRNFYLLNLIAFYMHQIFELSDKVYQKLRAKIGTRIEFFNNLRSFMKIPGYKDWYHFLMTIYDPENCLKAI